ILHIATSLVAFRHTRQRRRSLEHHARKRNDLRLSRNSFHHCGCSCSLSRVQQTYFRCSPLLGTRPLVRIPKAPRRSFAPRLGVGTCEAPFRQRLDARRLGTLHVSQTLPLRPTSSVPQPAGHAAHVGTLLPCHRATLWRWALARRSPPRRPFSRTRPYRAP